MDGTVLAFVHGLDPSVRPDGGDGGEVLDCPNVKLPTFWAYNCAKLELSEFYILERES